jgi:HD-GYP domain-containing protein (c-di-GMP phosphodiesterase class II)
MHDYGMSVDTAATVKLSAILSGLSYALDLTEGHPRGHASRSCLIGMRVARTLGLSAADQSDLFYALLLGDVPDGKIVERVRRFAVQGPLWPDAVDAAERLLN